MPECFEKEMKELYNLLNDSKTIKTQILLKKLLVKKLKSLHWSGGDFGG